MASKKLTRTELYKLVWENPLSQLAAQLEVKSTYLRKICMHEDIPLPPSGYWIRKQFGKADPTIPLWPRKEETVIDFQEQHDEPDVPKYYPGENELTFKVPARLIDPDPLIKQAEISLNKKDGHVWEGNLVRTEWDQLPIRVSKPNVGRALRIMDALVKCWRSRGYRIETNHKDAYLYIRKVSHRFSLREVTKKIPLNSNHDVQSYEATGQLAFRMDYWMGREWKDGKKPLEEQLFDITNQMELAAQDLEKSWAENKVREEIRQQKLDEERNIVLQKEIEQQKFAVLLDEARRWKEAMNLREYLKVLGVTQPSTPDFIEWLKWANEQADKHDPLLNKQREGEI